MKKAMTGMGSLWDKKWFCDNMKTRHVYVRSGVYSMSIFSLSACKRGRQYGEVENMIDRFKHKVKNY